MNQLSLDDEAIVEKKNTYIYLYITNDIFFHSVILFPGIAVKTIECNEALSELIRTASTSLSLSPFRLSVKKSPPKIL